MSSILKALKKLEKEAVERDQSPNWASEMVDTEAVYRRAGRKRRVYQRRAIVGGVVVVLLAGGLIYHFKRPETAHDPVATVQAPLPPPSAQRVPPAAVKAAGPASAASAGVDSGQNPNQQKDAGRSLKPSTVPPDALAARMAPLAGSKPSAPGPSAGTAAESAAATTPAPESRLTPRKPSAAVRTTTPPRRAAAPAAARAPARPAAQPQVSTAPNTAAGKRPAVRAELLRDARLKLEAIAWASDPAGRMAVINGQIVREGGYVEGFAIAEIGPDEVIVREKGRSWRLEFSLGSRKN